MKVTRKGALVQGELYRRVWFNRFKPGNRFTFFHRCLDTTEGRRTGSVWAIKGEEATRCIICGAKFISREKLELMAKFSLMKAGV